MKTDKASLAILKPTTSAAGARRTPVRTRAAAIAELEGELDAVKQRGAPKTEELLKVEIARQKRRGRAAARLAKQYSAPDSYATYIPHDEPRASLAKLLNPEPPLLEIETMTMKTEPKTNLKSLKARPDKAFDKADASALDLIKAARRSPTELRTGLPQALRKKK